MYQSYRLATAQGISIICINIAHEEWWGAYGFEIRRGVGLTALFMAGCGIAWQAATHLISRHPRRAAAVFFCTIALLNCLFLVQVKQGKLDLYKTRSFTVLLTDQLEMILRKVGYPFSWPANWIFAARYRVSPEKYDTVIGNYLFSWDIHERRQTIIFGRNDQDEIGYGFSIPESEERPIPEIRTVGDSPIQQRIGRKLTWRWSEGPRSLLLFSIYQPEPLRLTLHIQPFSPAGKPTQKLTITVNGHRIDPLSLNNELHDYNVHLPGQWLRPGVNALIFEYAYTASPADTGLGIDRRQLAVQFFAVTFTQQYDAGDQARLPHP